MQLWIMYTNGERMTGNSNQEFDLTWHSTPQLWLAMRPGVCGCPECKPVYGTGKTQEAAIKALLECEEQD